MGLLDKLWDDTVAGPRPESGLGKLRKYNSINFRSSSGKDSEGGSARSDESTEKGVRVTRSIMIVKPRGYDGGSPLVSPSSSTPPISPAGYSPLTSPFSGSRQGIRIRRSASEAYEKAFKAGAGDSSSP